MMDRMAQNDMALKFAAAELEGDREIVLASTTNLASHCAKLRLALATCALAMPSINCGRSLSALPRDLMELIGMCISSDVAICVAARKYGYWCDGGTPTRGREDSGHKKRKRLHKDDVVE